MRNVTTLDNRIRVITQELKDRDSTSVGLWFGVGGRYENSRNKGVAHFMEHMAFKGSAHYSCDEVKQLIEGVGGNLNAFTGEEETCYYAKVPRKHFRRTFDVLADISCFPTISREDLEKERTVILEEIKMYHDLPQYYVMELLEGLLWPSHPLGESLAGSQQTVSCLQESDLRGFQQKYYVPNKMVVSVCGDIKHDDIVRDVQKKLGRLRGFNQEAVLPADNSQDQARASFFLKQTEQMHLALGYLSYETNHPDYYVLALLSLILGGNMSSRLFNEVREKRGLAYSIGSSLKTLDDTGVFMVRAGVDNLKIEDALALILKVLQKIAKQSVEREELNRAKEYFLGQFQLGLEDTMDYMIWIGSGLISQDRTNTPKLVAQKIKKVTIEDIKRVAQHILNPKRLNLSLIGPLADNQISRLKSIAGV